MNYLIASVPYKEGDKHTFIDRIYSDMEEWHHPTQWSN
jgi:hypothetical protein